MQTLQTEQATPFDSSLARHSWWRRPAWWRWAAWATVCAVVWGGYFRWRAPGPILDLKHREHLGAGSRAVSLNFDDAPHPVITPLLLASLQRSGARASFFVIGDGVTRYPELSRRILLEGHAMENHSQNHRNLSGVPREEFKREVLDAFGSIARAQKLNKSGRPTRLFRPPGGGMNRDVMEFLWRNDVTLAWWSNNVGDWARPPAWKIADGVKAHLTPGDIILLHDAPGGYGTPQAVPAIVRAARLQGLECVVMPE